MKNALLVVSSLAFAACETTPPTFSGGGRVIDDYRLAETVLDEGIKGRPTYQAPYALPACSTRVIPFAVESEKRWFGDSDNYREDGLGAAGNAFARATTPAAGTPRTIQRSVRWHNAVFHDLESSEQWTLLDERGVIPRYWARFARGEHANMGFELMIFAATVEDSNGDQRLDDRDATLAIVTDGDGRHPRAITPKGTQLSAVAFDSAPEIAYLLVRHDENGDGKFTEEEAPRPYLYRYGDGAAKPLLKDSIRGRVEALLE